MNIASATGISSIEILQTAIQVLCIAKSINNKNFIQWKN
jgi:hypothetical protein